jgi:hypothetical protein
MNWPVVKQVNAEAKHQINGGGWTYTTTVVIESRAPIGVGDKLQIMSKGKV